MRKPTKILLTILGIVIAIPLVGIAIIAAVFDPNDYKPMLVDLVKEKKQRTLAIPGDLSLSFFPSLGVQLGQTSLSERNSEEVFASIEQAKLSVELLPLFSGRLVVDHIVLDGLTARLQRAADGSTNIDDLLAKDEEDGQDDTQTDEEGRELNFSVDGIRISNANLTLDDRQEKRLLQASNLQLETGPLADGVASKISFSTHLKGENPQIATNVSVQSDILFDRTKQAYAAKNLIVRLDGAYADWKDLAVKISGNADIAPTHFLLSKLEVDASGKQGERAIQAQVASPELSLRDEQIRAGGLQAKAQLKEGAQNIAVNLSAPAFEGSAQAFTLPSMVLDATIKQADLDAKATLTGTITGNLDKQLFASPQLQLALEGKRGSDAIQGTLTTPFTADMNAKLISLNKIVAAFTLPNPAGGQLKTAANGSANANLDREQVSLAFKGNLDQSNFDLKADMTGFEKQAYQFDAVIDKIDVDRYMASETKTASAPASSKEGPEEPIDLSALNDIKANGSIRIGVLKAANINASNVRVDMQVANGKAEITPLEARLYGGSLSGAITASATKPARFTAVQRLNGINIGPLLKDAMESDAPIEGKGNVQFNITAVGDTVSQLKKGLNGTGQLELRDGSIRGVNIARTVRNAKASLASLTGKSSDQAGVSNADERTDFSELKGSFKITNGVLQNEDLSAKSPLLRMNGNGSINLVEENLDYLVKASVVSTLKGQDGADLEALKGLTIPVRLSGPFTSIGWKIDAKSLIGQQAQGAIDEKKEELRSRAKEEVATQKEKAKEQVKDQLKDRLKGLLGN